MGCHTWFSIPYLRGKDEIIKQAKEYLIKNDKYISKGHNLMYQYAIDSGIEDVIIELASFNCDGTYHTDNRLERFIIYKDVTEVSLENYNKEHNTNYDRYDIFFTENNILETYSNEPRISGYPERIIISYDDMVDFMSTGFTSDNDGEPVHYNFYYDEDRKEKFMSKIKDFFVKHPDGVISFG